MNDPIAELQYVQKKLEELRFAGTDQNPGGIRDLLFWATRQLTQTGAILGLYQRCVNQIDDYLEYHWRMHSTLIVRGTVLEKITNLGTALAQLPGEPVQSLGGWVNARPMTTAPKGKDAPPVLLYFPQAVLDDGRVIGPLWLEGSWGNGYLDKPDWQTDLGVVGEPTAWAPLPKALEDEAEL